MDHSNPHVLNRRTILRTGLVATTMGAGAWAFPEVALAHSGHGSQVNAQVAEIYRLQADFHRAKTFQDLDLMMSLWAPDATLAFPGDPNAPYTGAEAIRGFFARSGSFTHRRFSFVPSFKTQISVDGETAWLYFECHDVGDYDLPTRSIVSDTYLAGDLHKHAGSWLFADMHGGSAAPLSADHYYYP